MERYGAWAEQGAVQVIIPGTEGSTDVFQESCPSATITVYNAGTLVLATIFSDNSSTPLANPFSAQSNGYFFFYAADGRYDIKMSGSGFASPVTISDVQLFDSQSSQLLSAIAALGSNGLITRLSSSTAAARTVTGGTNISVTNGNGVAGNPTIDIASSITGVTINGNSNTLTVLAGSQLSGQVPLANGGLGSALSDPGADRIVFWDDSNGVMDWLTIGAGLSISGTTLSSSATGTITGSGTSNFLPKFSGTTALTDSAISDDGTTVLINGRNGRITGTLAIGASFTAQAPLHIKSTANGLILEETDAASNEKVWLLDMTAGVLALKTPTDAYASGGSVFSVDRAGTAPLFLAMNTRFQTKQGANVASANDLTLGTDGSVFRITGTTTINAITNANWQGGSEITFIFDASVTVKNNTAGGAGTSKMRLAGGSDLSATANDVLCLVFDSVADFWYEKCRSVN